MELFFQFLSRWGSLLLLFCFFLLFNVLLNTFLPKEHALDLMFAYTADDAYAAVEQLNPNERKIYALGIWVLDMPYLGIYCLFFAGILIKIWKNTRMALLPAAIMVMDFFENVTVLGLLHLYPVRIEILANTASFFSTAKWILVGALLVTLLTGLFSLVVSRRYLVVNSPGARI